MRNSEVRRETAETSVVLSLELDGSGRAEISTGVGFLDHMLTLLALHGGFDLSVSCKGDLEVDAHHSVEDIGLCFGAALVLLRLCGKAASKMPLVAAVPLAVYTVAHFLPPAATVAAVAFVAFSVVMLWFAASMIRAYNDARVKK